MGRGKLKGFECHPKNVRTTFPMPTGSAKLKVGDEARAVVIISTESMKSLEPVTRDKKERDTYQPFRDYSERILRQTRRDKLVIDGVKAKPIMHTRQLLQHT